MKNYYTKNFLILFAMLLAGATALAQTTISGNVKDDSGEPLIGVNILVKGTVTGTITDVNGDFSLSVSSAPPITLVFTSIGFESQELAINSAEVNGLEIAMNESVLLGQEVVVSASRVEESILKSPVSIEKMDILSIQNTASDNYYKAIANLKGVDVATSSINFQIINARGFASTGNTRFVQLTDGMDTQAPALNFPIGNLNGPSELDVESLELIPGASSALYGPNAFNGILLVNSKSPFEYQGASAFAKVGVNHVGSNADQDPAPMYEFSLRYAKAFNNKFAFKANVSYMQADDWHGTSDFDRNAEGNPFASIGGENPGADKLHFMGDEAAINLAIFPFSDNWRALAQSRVFGPGLSALDYAFAGDLPNHVVSVSPYEEVDLINYGAENLKLNGGLYYRLTDKLELSYLVNYGYGTSIYTGAQRYSLSNFNITQHRVQLRGDNFFVRGYGTFEDSGDSYITEFLAKRVMDINSGGDVSSWLANYGVDYIQYLNDQGYAPGDLSNLSAEDRLLVQQAAHQFARQSTEARFNPEPGSDAFEQAKERGLEGVVPFGPKFNDQSGMYHAEAQYDFKNEISVIDLQAGASFRMFALGSNGTIFPDGDGNEINIKEYGAYAQAAKQLGDLKLSGSLRFDKNENFDGQLNPRLSGVYTVGGNHNFRASVQTGFRNPTTQGQFIDLNIITARLLGGLPGNYEAYELDKVSVTDVPLAYTGGSVLDFRNAIFSGQTFDEAASQLVPFTDVQSVKPEQVRSLEFGYKSLIGNKLLVDLVYYHNTYNDFITQIRIVKAEEFTTDASLDTESSPYGYTFNPDPAAEGTPNYGSILNGTSDNTFQIYTNLDDEVTSQGLALGLTYSLPGGYRLGGNYSWNKLIGGFTNNNLSEFNTPPHKVNLNFGNRKLIDNLGFNITMRWQDEFRWESSFAQGPVPSYTTVDAQLSYRMKELKSILKVGGSNIFNQYYVQSLGGPNIGAIYYVSVTFDQLMN